MAGNYQIKNTKSGEKALDYVLLVIFIGIIFITVYPFLNVLAISLNDPMDTMRNVNFIFPRKFTFSNYTYVFTENSLGVPFLMSVARTLTGTGLGVICTAMIAYVPDVSLDENRERMTEAAGSVRTGSVTYAIRDSVFDGKEIKENDILGLNEGTVACVGQNVADTAIELMRTMLTEEDELITLFYGADVSEQDAENMRARIEENFPDCDLEMLSGGQPLYYYLFSIE